VNGDRLINDPFHYRDERTARGVDLVHKIADHATLYATNGLQFQPFNSIYQLAVDRKPVSSMKRPGCRRSLICWDSGLPGPRSGSVPTPPPPGCSRSVREPWNATLIDKLSLRRSLFPSLVDPGSRVGSLRDDVAAEVGAALDVIAVGSHDTASSGRSGGPPAHPASTQQILEHPSGRLTSLTGWHVRRLRNRPVLPENWRLQQNSHALTGATPWSCA
jgi:rhamnulokinase